MLDKPIKSVTQPLEYSPWGYARPYDGGFRYNCMMLQVPNSQSHLKMGNLTKVRAGHDSKSVKTQLTLEDSGSERATSLGYSINDETCEVAGILMLQ